MLIVTASTQSTKTLTDDLEGRILCVKLFTLFTLFVVPAMDEFLYAHRIRHTLDPQDMLDTILDEFRTRRNWLDQKKYIVLKALNARNCIYHLNATNINVNWRKHLRSLITFLELMDYNKEADILSKEMNQLEKNSVAYLKKLRKKYRLMDKMHLSKKEEDAILDAIEIFEGMALILHPAMEDFFGDTLPFDEDPMKNLQFVRDEIRRSKYWLNCKDNTALSVRSYNGRTTICHLDVKKIRKDGKDIIRDWSTLLDEMSKPDAAKSLRAILKRL